MIVRAGFEIHEGTYAFEEMPGENLPWGRRGQQRLHRLASRLKRQLGTGVLVVCGHNSKRGGVLDYWACPVEATEAALEQCGP